MTPTTFISARARLGFDVRVWHFAVILDDCIISDHVSIGSGTEIGRASFVGENTRISAHVFLPARSRIGRNVFIGPGTVFTDDRHPVAGNHDYKAEPPTVGDHASIGAGCVILPGVHIGSHAVIGAGSVITKGVLPGAVVYGEAARQRAVPPRDLTSLFDPPLCCEPESNAHPVGEAATD